MERGRPSSSEGDSAAYRHGAMVTSLRPEMVDELSRRLTDFGFSAFSDEEDTYSR